MSTAMVDVEHVLTRMARERAPEQAARRPGCRVEGLVFDAVVGLPNPPSPNVIAHWTEFSIDQVRRALDRLLARGLIAQAGKVPRAPRGAWMTYRVAG